MHQDSFRSVVCRSLSKSLPSRSKDGSSYPESAQCAAPCVVTLQPSVCRNYKGSERSASQSYQKERSMSFHGDYLMGPSLSKHFAEDLLRGAMDLQESLAMLERFQDASQSMRLSNKKRRPEAGDKSPEIDTIIREVLLRPSSAKQVLPRTANDGLHGQLSLSTDELKNVVKDSFYRKNLLSVSSSNEQAYLSQSARYLPNNYMMSKSTQQKKVVPRSLPSCAAVQPDKSKAPSLVAKLMGLDGLPSQKDSSIMKEDRIKTVSSPRALFDIEMPKSKRPPQQLFGEESSFDTEMPRSENQSPEYYTVQKNPTSLQKGISASYDTRLINQVPSMKPYYRERNVEQARSKSVMKEIKVISPTSRKQQTKETTEINRRTREKQKPYLSERNREGRNTAKAKAGRVSRNTKVVKKDDKKSIASSSSRTSDSIKPMLQKTQPNKPREKRVARRNVKSSTIDELVAYEIEREIIHALDKLEGPSTEYSATPSEESCPSADWDEESSVGDNTKDSSETLLSASHDFRISSADEEAVHPWTDRTARKEAEIKDEISLFLLSDKPFLSRAAELIGGVDVYERLNNHYSSRISKVEMENGKLYLDTAGEQLERKHWQQNRLCYTGFKGQRCRPPAYLSLEELLMDISNGIGKIKGYSCEDARGGSKDSLDMKVERDLRCTDASINGIWDMGWQGWVCMEQTECLIRDAGEGILAVLIEEVASDMCTRWPENM